MMRKEMILDIYQVDAFSSTLFGGNPAAVCPLQEWIGEEVMKKIANENNLSETAFFVSNDEGFHIRWFTPALKEVDLCGHATLAASHVIFQHLGFDKKVIAFDSASGPLNVKKEDNKYVLNFPSDVFHQVDSAPKLLEALGIDHCESVLRGKDDYLVIVSNQDTLEALDPNMLLLSQIEARGVIVSTTGHHTDVVSRCFYPRYGVNEDPVTGSAHTTIIPYWAEKLGKTKFIANQISSRGGELHCNFLNDRVEISGSATTYMKGQIFI